MLMLRNICFLTHIKKKILEHCRRCLFMVRLKNTAFFFPIKSIVCFCVNMNSTYINRKEKTLLKQGQLCLQQSHPYHTWLNTFSADFQRVHLVHTLHQTSLSQWLTLHCYMNVNSFPNCKIKSKQTNKNKTDHLLWVQ